MDLRRESNGSNDYSFQPLGILDSLKKDVSS